MNNLRLKNHDIKKPQIKKSFNKNLFTVVAPKYDLITKILSFGRDKSWKNKLIQMLPDLNNPVCLDIACGTGEITRLLLNRYKKSKIYGIDLNKEMLEIARLKNDKIIYKQTDMENLDFKKDGVDIITGGYALRNSWDLKKALNEIKRVLKKGGIAAFLDFSKSPNKIFQVIQLFFLKLWGNIWGFIIHKNPDIYGYIAESLKNFPDNKNLVLLLKEIGFTDIKIKLLFFGFTSIVIFKK